MLNQYTPKTLKAVTEGAGVQTLVWYLSDETGTKRCITDERTAQVIENAFNRVAQLEDFVRRFYESFQDCIKCNGSGYDGDVEYPEPCDYCGGEGRIIADAVLYQQLQEEARVLLKGQPS